MPNLVYREAKETDITSLAAIRAVNSVTKDHWADRIQKYLQGLVNPQQALRPRIIYVAEDQKEFVGFIAGHLTRRYDCDGELQWIDTIEEYRRKGVATSLVKFLAKWFIDHRAYKICVDPGNDAVRRFYNSIGAESLNDHWMFWQDISKIL